MQSAFPMNKAPVSNVRRTKQTSSLFSLTSVTGLRKPTARFGSMRGRISNRCRNLNYPEFTCHDFQPFIATSFPSTATRLSCSRPTFATECRMIISFISSPMTWTVSIWAMSASISAAPDRPSQRLVNAGLRSFPPPLWNQPPNHPRNPDPSPTRGPS